MSSTTTSIASALLFANPRVGQSGYTWTLASRLGDMLHVAEELYGPRDPNYTILGVEFGGDIPQIWFPGNRRHVVIQITNSCALDLPTACYQMAHEVIHLLSPTRGGTTVLEEGLATHFAVKYMREHFKQPDWPDEKYKSYLEAKNLTEELLAFDYNVIQRIRQGGKSMAEINAKDLQVALPSMRQELAEALAQRFQRM